MRSGVTITEIDFSNEETVVTLREKFTLFIRQVSLS